MALSFHYDVTFILIDIPQLTFLSVPKQIFPNLFQSCIYSSRERGKKKKKSLQIGEFYNRLEITIFPICTTGRL